MKRERSQAELPLAECRQIHVHRVSSILPHSGCHRVTKLQVDRFALHDIDGLGKNLYLDVVIIADSQRGLMKIGRLDDVAEKVPMRADVEVNRRCSCSECFCEFGAEVVRCHRSTPPQKEMWIIDRGRCRDAVASERG